MQKLGSQKIPRLTLDTNLLQEFWKDRQKAILVKRLLELSDMGQIELAVTTRVYRDIPDPPLSMKINKLPQIGITTITSVFRLGVSALGQDALGGDGFENVASMLQSSDRGMGNSAPDFRDWDHLHGHLLANRDVFLTWDKGILRFSENLRETANITVMTPDAYIQRLGTAAQAIE